MSISKVSASTQWSLQVNNANTTVNYSYDQLLAMPVTTVNTNLACYGSPIARGDWSGVSLGYLLEQSGLDQTIVSVNFAASDGYKVSLSLDEVMQSNVIIAYQFNGVPLGETLRLVMPGYNGNVWISRITSITMSASTAQSSSSGNVVKVPDNSVWPSRIPPSAPAQNTSLNNETAMAPIAPSTIPSTVPSTLPSTNVTQPTQSTSVQQESNPKDLGFPVEVAYGIALGATVALVVATIALVRRRDIRKIPSFH
jgi:hypothetical protein